MGRWLSSLLLPTRRRAHGDEAQEDVPQEAHARGDEDAPAHRHPEEVAHGHDGPEVPAGAQQPPQLVVDDGQDVGQVRHARHVGDDEEHRDHDAQPDRLVRDELGDDVPPADPRRRRRRARPWHLVRGCRRGRLQWRQRDGDVLVLLSRRDDGQDRSHAWDDVRRELALQEVVPDVADMGADEAKDGELKDALAVQRLGLRGAPLHGDLGGQVRRGLDEGVVYGG